MKATRFLFCLMFVLCAAASISSAQAITSANGDTIYIPGDMLNGSWTHQGLLETTINDDITAQGARINPNRVYALNEGQVYIQQNPLNVNNPTGTLTIVGIPSINGTTKPVWLMKTAVPGTPIVINNNGCNVVYGSIDFENIHYEAQQLDGTLQNENFYCGTKNSLPQSLTINNCLFEFSNFDLFDCTNETGSIGGWPNGAKFRITNSYFRNLFINNSWWNSRIFQCKHPIDTLWIENVTMTGGGLPFLMQESLTAFAYLNHNTIVNNHKYWLLSQFYKELYITNNIFINQNWVGEDSNVTTTDQDPDHEFMSTINIDSINTPSFKVLVQQKYSNGNGGYTDAVSLKNMKVYVSNNINYYNPLLNAYFTNAGKFYDTSSGYVLSYLNWSIKSTQRVNNMPGEWMNTRTKALFTAYSPGTGKSSSGCGFIEENTTTASPFSTAVDQIATNADVQIMGEWNQNKYSDPRWPNMPDVYHSKMIYGDFDPTTIPGGGTETGGGITHFTDLPENFNQSNAISSIDGLPVGSLSWNNAEIAAFNSANDFSAVTAGYQNALSGGSVSGIPNNILSWTIGISAAANGISDSKCYLGVASVATDGFDKAYDFPKPPEPPSKYVYSYFPHPEWNYILGPNFSTDIRHDTSLTNQGKIWNYTVATDQSNQTMILQFSLSFAIPSGYPVTLLDMKTGNSQDLRANNSYAYNTGTDADRSFQIIVGNLSQSSGPSLTLSPSSLLIVNNGNFSSTNVGAISAINAGNTTLTGTLSFSGSSLLSVSPSTLSISAGSSSNITVSISSVSVADGIYSGTITIIHNAPGSPTTIPIQVRKVTIPPTITASNQFTFSGTNSGVDYELIGIPGTTSFLASTIFSGTYKQDWRMYLDNGSAANYLVEYDGSSNFNFGLGKGFWVLADKSNTLSATLSNYTSSGAFPIPVQSGAWNIITNPFALTVSWNDVITYNQLSGSNSVIYSYNNGSWSVSASLVPYTGYYFYSDNLSALFIPYDPNGAPASQNILSQSTPPVSDQHLKVSISTGNVETSNVYAAFDEHVGNGYNSKDYFAPPSSFAAANIQIEDSSLTTRQKRLWIEHRAAVGEGQRFHLVVKNTSAVSSLTFKGIDKFPNDQVYLLDEKRNELYNLRLYQHIDVPTSSSEYRYSLLIGGNKFIDSMNAVIVPNSYYVAQNYPNPFNPATTIEYTLPQQSHVKMVVYDIMGREVATLVDGFKSAGKYVVLWNASRCASGVYLCRLTTGTYSSVRKMLLMK